MDNSNYILGGVKWAEDATESKGGNPFTWVRFAKIIALIALVVAMPVLMEWLQRPMILVK